MIHTSARTQEEIDKATAEQIFTKIFNGYDIEEVSVLGESQGIMPSYNVQAMVSGTNIYAQISKVGGKPAEPDRWGVRKYAYPVHYKTEGYYCLINFEAEDSANAQITSKLNINKHIVRQMIVAK